MDYKYLYETNTIIKDVLKEQKETAEAGFDLTLISDERDGEIGAQKWIKILKSLGISTQPKLSQKDYAWVWQGKNIAIYTGNDPISGKYATGKREDKKGYASSIGIEGDSGMVQKAFSLIKRNAEYIKGSNKTRREFI